MTDPKTGDGKHAGRARTIAVSESMTPEQLVAAVEKLERFLRQIEAEDPPRRIGTKGARDLAKRGSDILEEVFTHRSAEYIRAAVPAKSFRPAKARPTGRERTEAYLRGKYMLATNIRAEIANLMMLVGSVAASDRSETLAGIGTVDARAEVVTPVSLPPNWEAERAEMRRRVEELEAALREIAPLVQQIETSQWRAGLGHNRPPPEAMIEGELLGTSDINIGIAAANVFRTQLSVERPDFSVIRVCGLVLDGISANALDGRYAWRLCPGICRGRWISGGAKNFAEVAGAFARHRRARTTLAPGYWSSVVTTTFRRRCGARVPR
jgi:hypothetical protein